jgi:uncharacterized protein (TIGR03437 family)
MTNWQSLAILTLLYAPVLAAQTGNWTQQSPQTSPPARAEMAMAYDSARGQTVLFGGTDSSATFFNDSWVWDGSNWTLKTPQTMPPGRSSHAMAYDSAHGEVVLFGGWNLETTALYNDTWVWDGSNWTKESPQTSPSARLGQGMAYDSAHGEVVMSGGFFCGSTCGTNVTVQYLSDTWLWDGSNWSDQFPQTSPPGRTEPAMAYDSGHDQVVLFGGSIRVGKLPTGLGDTWTWFGGPLPPAGPSISGVVSASDFGGFSSVAPGSWVEIYGSALAPGTQGWTGSDFTGNNAPTMLNGVSVSIGGEAAFIDYISATQVNAQLPSNIATGGPLQLTVTNGTETSAPVNVTVNPTEPGLLAPTSFQINGKRYVVAQHADGTYVLATGAMAGVASSPAKPGETIVIYGVGFGSVTPNIPAGEIATESNQLSAPLQILFGKTPAKLPYYGLAPNFVGLYQFNVTVPAVGQRSRAIHLQLKRRGRNANALYHRKPVAEVHNWTRPFGILSAVRRKAASSQFA